MRKKIEIEYDGNKEIKKGIKTFKVKTWKGFNQCISEEFVSKSKKEANKGNKYYLNDYIWRGHRCTGWDLISYFDREFRGCCEQSDKGKEALQRDYILKRHSTSFAYACRNKLREFGIDVRDFWGWIKEEPKRIMHLWALGQHYGFATPMLDWCYSPFVAAFFAFEEGNILEDINWTDAKTNKKLTDAQRDGIINKFKECVDKADKKEFTNKLLNEKLIQSFGQKRVIWGLNLQITNLHKKLVPQITYFDPMSSEYPRMINQRGLFTITDHGEDILALVQKNWKETERDRAWLIKIEIENENLIEKDCKNREDFLRGLDLMNINHMSIFSEIYGAAKFSNFGLEFDNYARFHGQGPKVEDDPRKICNNCQKNQ